jgi:hypothetical protein
MPSYTTTRLPHHKPANKLAVTSQNEKTTLLGKTKQDYASILKWMSFANTEVLPKLGGWYRPVKGLDSYNKKNVEDSQNAALKAVHAIEEHLLINTYLVGERLTLADIFVASLLLRGFEAFFDKKWRGDNPNTTRWYETVTSQPIYTAVAQAPAFIDEAIKYQPPKKEAAPKAAAKKAEPKPKAVAAPADEEDDEPAPAPKAKHPLEALGRSTFVLDDWKRKYSNEDTRSVALPWFWENANFEEYSLWRVDYKYNDELTMTFMTSNLIGEYQSLTLILLCNSLTQNHRWLLQPPRGQPQVHLRRRLRLRRIQRLHRPRRFLYPWPGGSASFRRCARLRELRIHQARPSQGQGVRQRHVGLGQAYRGRRQVIRVG